MSVFTALLAIFRLIGYFTEPSMAAADIHAVAGEPYAVTRPHTDASARTLVTWNIERGVKFDQIAATLQALDPDLVLLQEVDRSCSRSGNRHVARDLARHLGMNWVTAGEFQ